MRCIYNTWLDDLVIDGMKYVKVKEEFLRQRSIRSLNNARV